MNYTEEASYDELRVEYDKLFLTNKELRDGMCYSAFVQRGILPHERHLRRIFSDYFVIYQPQNVVSGDLYWVAQRDGWKFFAVGDCTGHGVSGALLTVLGLAFLNYIVLGKDYFSPGQVLEELDKKWIETFHQGAELGYSNDWMELGFCAYNETTRELKYAGAFNKLVCIDDNGIRIIVGNRYPIGGWQLEENRKFEVHTEVLKGTTMAYLFSDGFKDQFSAACNKRLGTKRFIEALQGIHKMPVDQQKNELLALQSGWRGSEEQTDDVCILGVKL